MKIQLILTIVVAIILFIASMVYFWQQELQTSFILLGISVILSNQTREKK